MVEQGHNRFKEAFNFKVIYVFQINDTTHQGLLKIGDATLYTDKPIDQLPPNCKDLNKAAHARIKTYTNTAGIVPQLLHTELAIKYVKKNNTVEMKAFRDYDVHKVLENSNIKKAKISGSTGKEWYKISLETAIKAIGAVKKNYGNLSNSQTNEFIPIIFRPEQEEAIQITTKQFQNGNRMLWNAKMRFGKTLSALEVVKRCGFHKTIIITHRPVVNAGWYEDFSKIFYNMDYLYGSKVNGNSIESLISNGKSFVYFASIQDLRGSSIVGGKHTKNLEIFETEWDCVIVDEAHEGTQTTLGDDTIKAIVKDNTKFLALSGTPFNIIDSFEENAIYTWDYIMEQEAKSKWDKNHFGDSNPYEELPELKIYTYNLGDLLDKVSYNTFEDKAFNFHEFFRTWTGDVDKDYAPIPNGSKVGGFVHEDDMKSFLNLLVKEDALNCYPYSKEEYRQLFRHSLWIVPGVKEAKALRNLMLVHPVFGSGQFDIVNVAGSDDEESIDALNSVKDAIAKAEKLGRYTITISCGKLTTGVTIKEWTAVFMLAGSYSTSASNYLQTIFRVQSPCNKNGKIKEAAYVFDFAPDRTLKMISEAVSVSAKAGKTGDEDKRILGKFLNYCPVISISGSCMEEYQASRLLQELKKAYAAKVVMNGFDDAKLYNDELFRLQDVDLEKFDKLKAIIGQSNSIPRTGDITINNQGLSNEEVEEIEKIQTKKRKDRTPEEIARLEELKKLKEQRKSAISNLRIISIRMPLLIYGADMPYDQAITLETFIELVDDASWGEFMPKGVTKELFKDFKRFYDEDIFIAAGRNIRSIAREADTLLPEERVKKIAALFSYFKNPDKETVLTPWRVVNMHLSASCGGYDFFDENYSSVLDTPRFVDRGEITSETMNNLNAKILEINSKTGLYPLWVAYNIYKAKCKEYKSQDLTFAMHQRIWNEVIQDNIFVICKTPMAKYITKRTLVGYSQNSINAHYFDDLLNQLEHKSKKFIKTVLKPSYWNKEGNEQMKFDAVVGNPPYQESTQDTSDKQVYNYFMDAAFKISDKVSFITPARFLFNAGKTPKEWNKKMLNDEHFKVVWYKANSREVFPNVGIKGGVAVTYRDAKRNFGKIGTFITNPMLSSILNKVVKHEKFTPIVNAIYLQNKFNLKKLYEDYPSFKEYIGSNGREKRLTTSIFELASLFTDTKEHEDSVLILGLIDNVRVHKYIREVYLEEQDSFNSYKVIVPKSSGSGDFGEKLSTPMVYGPKEGYTQSFIGIGNFNNKKEATYLLKYLKTKFARALLGTLKVTQDNNKNTWNNVPLEDFTDNSDIDWSKSISEIDFQLYKKYGLSDEEQKFIESNVEPM